MRDEPFGTSTLRPFGRLRASKLSTGKLRSVHRRAEKVIHYSILPEMLYGLDILLLEM